MMERPRQKRYILLFAIPLYIALYYFVLLYFDRHEGGGTIFAANLLSLMAAAASAAMLFNAVKRSAGKGKLIWLLFFWGSFSYSIAELIWIYYENILKADVPMPGSPDVFYMLQIVFYFAAISLLLRSVSRKGRLSKYFFDAVIIITVAATFCWHFFFRQLLADASASEWFLFYSIGYPVGDLVLLFGITAIYLGAGKMFNPRCFHLITLGMMIQIIADFSYSYLVVSDSYSSGSLIDPLYSLALLLMGASGLFAKNGAFDSPNRELESRAGQTNLFKMYLPYVSVFVLFLFMLRHRPDDNVFGIGSGIAIILVMARQLFILAENRKLLGKFEDRTAELAISEQRYRSLFDHHSDAVFSLDLNGCFTSVNSSAGALLGYTRSELVGVSVYSILSPGNREKIMEHFEKTKIGNPQRFELYVPRMDNKDHYVSFISIPMKVNGQVVGVYGIGRDITENKENEEKITYMAYHDLLTGLPNRNLFGKLLTKTTSDPIEAESMHAVFFIDLDRFKIINDTLGHQVGDELLVAAAKRLERSLRSNDIVARQGGDEFTLLAKNLSRKEDAAAVARKIISRLHQPFVINGHDLRITASIGIAIYPCDGTSAVDLMKNADLAMYDAKEQGKDGYSFFSSEMNEGPSRKLTLENDLRTAVEKEELLLHYQPQYDTKTSKMTGAEALLRWNHPMLGMISPAEFIPIAEQSGLIIQMGEWILRSACQQGKKWLDAGHNLKIGVNLSPRQFYQGNLVEVVKKVLKETGLPPENLDLEITEGIAMTDLELVVHNLSKLRSLGIKVSIDDFGTGYSSLSYLSNIPIDTLKIAREFVDKVGVDKGNEAIIASIISMAKHLRLGVIAEGVETEKQSRFLQDLDCNLIQGYLYSKPLPVEELERMLEMEIRS